MVFLNAVDKVRPQGQETPLYIGLVEVYFFR